MNAHSAIILFIAGSVCILVSTVPQIIRDGGAILFTRWAAVFFILGSLLLW